MSARTASGSKDETGQSSQSACCSPAVRSAHRAVLFLLSFSTGVNSSLREHWSSGGALPLDASFPQHRVSAAALGCNAVPARCGLLQEHLGGAALVLWGSPGAAVCPVVPLSRSLRRTGLCCLREFVLEL